MVYEFKVICSNNILYVIAFLPYISLNPEFHDNLFGKFTTRPVYNYFRVWNYFFEIDSI